MAKEQRKVESRKFGNSEKRRAAHNSIQENFPKDNQWDNERKGDKIAYTKSVFLSLPYFIFCVYLFTHSYINEDDHGM